MKWLIYKRGPQDWRVARNPGYEVVCKTHREAVAHVSRVIEANRYAAVAA